MSQRWSTGKFALVMIPSVIFVGYILSQFFDWRIIAAIGVVTTIVSPVLQHHWKTTSQDVNDREEDDTEDTTDQLSPDEEQEADDTADPERQLDNNTADASQDTEDAADLLSQSSLLRSNKEIIEEVENKLDNYIEFSEDGTFEIDTDDDLNLYSRMMLEVIAKRLKYEYGSTDTPMMTVEELQREMDDKGFDYNRMEVVLFLDMAGGRLTPSHNVTLWTRDDYDDLENIEFSVGLKKLSEITDWALEEQRSSPLDLSIGLGNAAGWLSDASDTYSEMKKERRTASYYDPEEDFETICDHVLTACSDAKAYPVEIRRDSNWKKFTYYSAGVLRGVDSVSHHLPRAQKYLENMQNIADEERGW